ncbi:MAG: hypothetical protein EU551_00815 [Promethearchaeota archaeon]|nr:MAG: hypothetical protein EU551_00815 [Candidatus Lokiarchaeota archaeon]
MNLYDLYVIYKGGQTIYHKRFGVVQIDQDLITAFLTAIDNFSKEVLPSSEPLKVIEKGDSKVLMAYSPDLVLALVCNTHNAEEMEELRNNLEKILYEILETYAEFLQTWRGNLRELDGIGAIIEENVQDILKKTPPPPLKTLIESPDSFYFNIDDRGVRLYNTLLRESRGFGLFLKKLHTPVEYVDMVLNEIHPDKLNAIEISNALGLDLNRVLAILRTLRVRGLVNIWM